MTTAKLTCDRCKTVIQEYTLYDRNNSHVFRASLEINGSDYCEACAKVIWEHLAKLDAPSEEEVARRRMWEAGRMSGKA